MTTRDVRFADLYRRHHLHVRAYCQRRTSADRLDDAVADTFLVAWRRIDDVPAGDGALPWLYGVAFKVIGHDWRSASRRRSLDRRLQGLGLNPAAGPEELLVANEESRQVRRALDRLRKIDREIVLLAAWEGLSHSDIASALGIRPGTARQRLHQAKKNLSREYLRLERKRTTSPAAQEGGAQ